MFSIILQNNFFKQNWFCENLSFKRSHLPNMLLTGVFDVVIKLLYQGSVFAVGKVEINLSTTTVKPDDEYIWG